MIPFKVFIFLNLILLCLGLMKIVWDYTTFKLALLDRPDHCSYMQIVISKYKYHARSCCVFIFMMSSVVLLVLDKLQNQLNFTPRQFLGLGMFFVFLAMLGLAVRLSFSYSVYNKEKGIAELLIKRFPHANLSAHAQKDFLYLKRQFLVVYASNWLIVMCSCIALGLIL